MSLPGRRPGGRKSISVLAFSLCFLAGCALRTVPSSLPPPPVAKKLPSMGYAVQVGAFSRVELASRLTESLRSQGIDATFFIAEDKLYKVRFGNYPSDSAARSQAESLKAAGIIDDFFVVSPREYTVIREGIGSTGLREALVKTAMSFIGVPYLWGGTNAETGFDCSGLTMTVYQLHGLDLPRSAVDQAETGIPVDQNGLSKGDLVFFRASGDGKVSHVGIYTGESRFIHAPGRGKRIRMDSLSNRYFRKYFIGGRNYM